MYKLFVLAALCAVAVARPSHFEGSPLVYSAPVTSYIAEPALAKVGHVIKSYPTSVSHQSQSIVHSSAHVVEPIVAPVLKSYSVAAPLVHTSYAASPLVHSTYAAEPLVHSYAAAPAHLSSYSTYSASSPLSYGTAHGSPALYSSW